MEKQLSNIQYLNIKSNITKKNITFLNNLFRIYDNIDTPFTIKTNKIITNNYINLIPSHIQEYIYNVTLYDINIQFIYNKKIFSIHIFQEREHFKNKRIIKKIVKTVSFLSSFSKPYCSDFLSIHIFLTPFKKSFTNPVIDTKDINTAFTFVCKKNNNITIYRKEEWFKVLLHECIHSFGIDFSSMYSQHTSFDILLSNIFHIQNNYFLSEAYCEVWATIINVITLYNKNIEFDKYITHKLHNESVFSLIQSYKFLKLHNIHVYDFMNKKTIHYTENTPGFSYIVIKSVFMYNLNSFINICTKYNGLSLKNKITENTILDFIELIKTIMKKGSYKKDINNIRNSLKNNELGKTFKFSLYG